MSENKIQETKEALLLLSTYKSFFEPDRTIIRNGANAINQLQQENKQLKSQLEQTKEEVKAVNRGLRKVINKRSTWKNRYYNTKRKLKQRDDVIDGATQILGDLSTRMIIISNSDYVYNQDEICNIVFKYQNEILEILKKVED